MDQNKIQQEVEKMRPFFQKDGGDIEFIKVTNENEIFLRLTGQCRACRVNKEVTREGVEAIIKENIPEVQTVYLDAE